jgi:transcriptional regulator with XRE-family HTH domain
MRLSETLRAFRKTHGITQEEAAAHLKRKLSTLQKWESGKRNANQDTQAAVIRDIENYKGK